MIWSCRLLIVFLGCTSSGQTQGATSPPLDERSILRFLNQSVTWYQHTAVEQQLATTPGDLLFATNNRPVADQVVRLSFDFARTGAQLLSKSSRAALEERPGISQGQTFSQAVAKLDIELNRANAELASLRDKLRKAKPQERKEIDSAIAEAQSEQELLQTRRDLAQSFLQFVGGTAEPGGMGAEIDALERSVPSMASAGGQPDSNSLPRSGSVPSSSSVPQEEASSIIGGLRILFTLSHKIDAIKQNIRETDALKQSAKQIQDPLVAEVRDMVRESDSIINQPDSHDPAVLAQQKGTLDGLTARYSRTSSALLPLSKELVLLDVYERNLTNWEGAAKAQTAAEVKIFLVRMLGLAILLGIVLGAFELWRRAVFRYIQDGRRRYQFLLLRRIALWIVISLIVMFGMLSEIGSLATFAGLITAGIAVALQNVILAVVGYFLLIGKYGVRAGDRVQVAGVTGEVAEVGLIRLHVAELSGSEADAQPTGRIVAFSNSTVFQPNVGLFKQARGTSFVWHEIALTLAPESDYQMVEQRMLAAANAAFRDYRSEFERLRSQMESNFTSMTVGPLEPKVRFRLTAAGLEVRIQFPVALRNAVEVDDRVTRELLHAIEIEPKLKVIGADIPTIKLSGDPGSKSSVA